MPDPEKCGKAAACTSTQYFDGSQCVTSGSSTGTNPPACSSDQYWNGSACVVSPGGGGSALQRCFYPNATKSGQYVGYTVWCEADYVNCHEGSPSGASISLSGVALGAPSTCDSGWSGGGSGSGTGGGGVYRSRSAGVVGIFGSGCHSMGNAWFDSTMANYVMPNTTQIKSCASAPISSCSGSGSGQTTSCTSGQYWNGTACVNSTTTSCPSGQYWNGSSCTPTSTTDCTSGQYWNGSSCVTSSNTTTDYSAQQLACTTAGGTWDSSSNYCRMPSSTQGSSCSSGQYWNGSACVSSSPTVTDYSAQQLACTTAGGTWDSATNYCRMPGASAEQKPLAFLCPSGHDWNGSYCTLKSSSGVEMYVANVLSAFMSLIGF